MGKYLHKVHYYETDKMGITHHSNYIRWMEEARMDFLAKNDFDYVAMEKGGVVSPVVSVQSNFRRTVTYGETIRIEVSVKKITGAKLVFGYEMFKEKVDKVKDKITKESVFICHSIISFFIFSFQKGLTNTFSYAILIKQTVLSVNLWQRRVV